MNPLAYVGWGFYNASTPTEQANLWASWGLVSDLPEASAPSFVKRVWDWFFEFF